MTHLPHRHRERRTHLFVSEGLRVVIEMSKSRESVCMLRKRHEPVASGLSHTLRVHVGHISHYATLQGTLEVLHDIP